MIKIHRSVDNQFYFTVHALNHKVIATSEMYTRKSKAIKGAEALYKITCLPVLIKDITKK